MGLGYLFDILIAAFVGVVPLYATWLAYAKKRLPSMGLHVLALSLLAIPWSIVVYGSFVAPHAFVVKNLAVAVGEGARDRTVRIALVSDTHYGGYRFQHDAEQLVERVNAQQPDVILLLGDIASTLKGADMLRSFSDFRTQYGAYGVLGNWDYGAGAVDVRRAIEAQGVEILTNEAYQVIPGDDGLWIAGIDDVQFGDADVVAAVAAIPEGATTILATHNPDAAHDAEAHGVDLMVAGHTHGGQIRLPGVGPVAPLPTELGKKYDQGLFEIGPMAMVITSGVGESGPRARLFSPPEIVILTVTY